MFDFQTELIRIDVTAIIILKQNIIAGIGSHLHVFCRSTYKLTRKFKIFNGKKICGFILNNAETRLLVFGENQVKIYDVNENLSQFTETLEKSFKSWILAVKLLENETKIAIVLMSNKLLILDALLESITEISCEEKCIIYSAFICHNGKETIVLSGTVFSEVLIWGTLQISNGSCRVLKRLKHHKGVIFSVDYNENSGYICSTSDDRSSVLWCIKHKNIFDELQQNPVEITVKTQVFGHLSRVFRCRILHDGFLSAGEDSTINIWNSDGKLMRKIEAHQGSPIWAIDCDETENIVVSGGEDCGITAFPIRTKTELGKVCLPESSGKHTSSSEEVPKAVGFLHGGKLVVISEKGALYYYNEENYLLDTKQFNELKNYSILAVSKCKKLVALSGFNGQIYILQQLDKTLQQRYFYQSTKKLRIYSFHWLTCSTFVISEPNGLLSLFHINNNSIQLAANFVIPKSKEPWSTTACFTKENNLVVGDRKGCLHLYKLGTLNPVQTLKKMHNHLGVTNIQSYTNQIVSLGRNGIIRIFTSNSSQLQLVSSDKTPFDWLGSIQGNLLLAFSGNNFVIYDYERRRVLCEFPCGGGHRSWDIQQHSGAFHFVYIKDKIINTINLQLDKLYSIDLIKGYHVKEINALRAITKDDATLLISGGEDTTIRMFIWNKSEFTKILNLKSHLSSIRALATWKLNADNYLVFSAGGRAQIILWKLCFSSTTCSEQSSYYEPLDSSESEMRIMDLTVVEIKEKMLVFCACSNGNIKVFQVKLSNKGLYELVSYKNIFYKLKCVQKVCTFSMFGNVILASMATDGCIVFWNITNILLENNPKPINSFIVHASGINSFSYKLTENLVLFLTGGDDNALHLTLFSLTPNNFIEIVDKFSDIGTHCAQVTGVYLSDNYFFSTSIDQKLAAFKWEVINGEILAKCICKKYIDVADVQGMEFIERNEDCGLVIYGQGIECVNISNSVL